MVQQQLFSFFMEEGYQQIPSNLPEFTLYFLMENNYANVLHVIDYQENMYITEDQHQHMKEKIKLFFLQKGVREVHILSLIICGDLKRASQFYMRDNLTWIVDPYCNRLIIFENQIADFYGMRKKLETFLDSISIEEEPEKSQKSISQLPYITIFLVAVNILIFIICTFTDDLLYNIGAFSASTFLEDKNYYRILVSIFLHWDIQHLASNMLVLYYLGEVVEKHFGRLAYTVIYLLSGICGNLLSIQHELHTEANIRSVGASGAIFGIMGALVVMVFIHKGRLRQISMGRLIFMITYSLYSGFIASDVNNAAHIGGLAGGLAIAALIWLGKTIIEKKYRNEGKHEN